MKAGLVGPLAPGQRWSAARKREVIHAVVVRGIDAGLCEHSAQVTGGVAFRASGRHRLADGAGHPPGQGRPRGLQGGPFFRGQLGTQNVQCGGRLLGSQPGQGANGPAGRALAERELPFNSDQGSPFTNEAFVGVLEAQGVRIGMEGRGRALDNVFVVRLWRSVTYEDIYLKAYAGVPELLIGLSEYFERDNPLAPINRWATPLPSLSIGRGRAVVPVSWTSIQ